MDPIPAAAALAATATESSWWDDPLWYKDAVIYQLHVKAFFDSNNDGVGDFPGLTQKLDYVRDLGVNTIWLLPFYASPLKDDGYDISDYHRIHPDYGTMGDFRHFMREAHKRGLKVVTELVINHTSDQHSWFQAARRAPAGSNKRNYYVWSDTDKKWPETRIIFTDTESSNWTWDPVAGAYYWHRFFSHQPDLNFNNPSVMKAVTRAMRFWLDMGVDGMRLDAIPYLCERDGTSNENLPETHAVLRYMRAELDKHYRNRFFLAEANQWPEDVREYFGNGDECHMAYHFPLMPRIYMSVAMEDRHPIVDIMWQTPEIPANCQWAIFLRNHDELTLEMVTEKERDYMYQIYAADKRMRVNVGIRRRLAPLMDNNWERIKLVNSLLLSLPGSPVLYYGDEIGMGDNFYLGDRNGVRTPMQWSPDRNGGFSRADPQRLYLPPIMDTVYGYEAVNVESQAASRASLLSWMRRMLLVRKAHLAFSRGALKFFRPGNRKVFVYAREYGGEVILCVANLSRFSQPVEIHLEEYKGRVPVEMLGRTAFPPIGELPYFITLPGYSFYWFLLSTDAKPPDWHEMRIPPSELPALVIPEGWQTLFTQQTARAADTRALLAGAMRSRLEQQVLPVFLSNQRWFAAKGRSIQGVELLEESEWALHGTSWLLAIARVRFSATEHQIYSLPLSLAWDGPGEDRLEALKHCTLARVRQRARVGILYDALWDDAFCRALIGAMAHNEQLPLATGRLVFSSTKAMAEHMPAPDAPIMRPAMEQSHTSVVIGSDKLIMKAYRRLAGGINPELEIGRFLTETSPFAKVAPLAGALEYHGNDGVVVALAVVQGFVPNQGNGWNYAVDYLQRFLDKKLATQPQKAEAAGEKPHAGFVAVMRRLGQRTGELHAALGRATGNAAFDPEPIGAADLSAWSIRLSEEALVTLTQLATRRADLAEAARAQADRVLAAQPRILDRFVRLGASGVVAAKTRYHGDLHLGQVLVSKNDFVIIDFEGEPSRSLEERREKHSPLKDVAGMLRSFSYAASTALAHVTVERREDRPRVEPYAAQWQQETAAAFLAGYQAAAAGTPSYPSDRSHFAELLECFMLEKALYELRYEMDNRPDWVGIPLAGLLEIMTAIATREAGLAA